jgi:outer membrane protein assembly factor BamB
MLRTVVFIVALATMPCGALFGADLLDPQRQWPQWRGPLGIGVAPHGDPPITWSETDNVRWKVAIPGLGHSTPIVWDDRIYLTTAVTHAEKVAPPERDAPGAHHNMPATRRQKFIVMAIDRRDGSTVWQRTVRDEQPHEGTHTTGSWASNSPVTDGEHLYASFGSRGLYALDRDGKVIWQIDFGDMRTRHGHGEGSSPALFGNTLIVNWDHQGESFIIALDKRTGKERWRAARDEITSWSTPLIVDHDGRQQVVISATRRVRSYDLASGDLIWEVAGLSRNVVASPVAADGFVYVANSYDWQAMLAIRLDGAEGDITGTDQVVWTRDRHTPYVPSPLLYDGMLFFLRHNQGILSNVDAQSGTTHFGPERLPGIQNVFASPVGAAGRVYIVDRAGTTVVIRRGAQLEVLARNRLDDSFSASPAVAGEELFLRGEKHLYCLAEESGARAPARGQ